MAAKSKPPTLPRVNTDLETTEDEFEEEPRTWPRNTVVHGGISSWQKKGGVSKGSSGQGKEKGKCDVM